MSGLEGAVALSLGWNSEPYVGSGVGPAPLHAPWSQQIDCQLRVLMEA